ncbi:hypothetical protein TNCT_230961 [Trichonephila clavata]|uniref:Uncharacterized protein n=1 Tax=Trichonephila clavata TaxID=2740835 RepID=A0A8X6M5Q4_TRICU|nr:hypothetical protein TNCT_230961 [Trichonephila clavata]
MIYYPGSSMGRVFRNQKTEGRMKKYTYPPDDAASPRRYMVVIRTKTTMWDARPLRVEFAKYSSCRRTSNSDTFHYSANSQLPSTEAWMQRILQLVNSGERENLQT